MYGSFRPGKEWLDTDLNPIQAHGGKLYYENEIYYWYGENKTNTTAENGIWTFGIKAYSSKDLYNWKDEGFIIEPEETDRQSPMHPTQRIDRPHIIYNRQSKRYICWLKISGEKACFAIFSASSFLGPYRLERENVRPFGKKVGDFDLIVKEETNQAYLFFDADHSGIVSCELTEDFMHTKKDYHTSFSNLIPPFVREAPAYFRRKDQHYLLTSGLTNYVPNPSEVAVSKTIEGPYTKLGNAHPDDQTASSYNSQISGVFKLPDRDLYIALADRWIIDYEPTAEKYDSLSRAIASRFDDAYQITDVERKQLMDSPIVKPVNTSISRYVWLPIEWENDIPFIRWKDEWKIEDYTVNNNRT